MPAAVRRLAAIGVHPAGHPLRGIRYLDSTAARRRAVPPRAGLGVRRTTLHAALADRAGELGIPVLPVRVTGFAQHRRGVTRRRAWRPATWWPPTACTRVRSAGPARWIRRPAPAIRGSGCAGTTAWRRGPTWSRCTGPRVPRRTSRPVADDLVGRRRASAARGGGFESRLAAFPALRDRLAGAAPASECPRAPGRCGRTSGAGSQGSVLLVGDASGYLDALTGEGIGVGAGPGGGPRGLPRGRAAPATTSEPGGGSRARHGCSPRACCGRGIRRCSRPRIVPGRAAVAPGVHEDRQPCRPGLGQAGTAGKNFSGAAARQMICAFPCRAARPTLPGYGSRAFQRARPANDRICPPALRTRVSRARGGHCTRRFPCRRAARSGGAHPGCGASAAQRSRVPHRQGSGIPHRGH